jgi:hypothetical protein
VTPQKELFVSVHSIQIAKARPIMLQAKAKELFTDELAKGCRPEIAPVPVRLEPPFQTLIDRCGNANVPEFPWEEAAPPAPEDLMRLQIWIPPDEKCAWGRSEALLRQLHAMKSPVAFEIVGNSAEIVFQFLCHRPDYPILESAFRGTFEQCVLTPQTGGPLDQLDLPAWDDLLISDYLPPPPYTHLLTRPDELEFSPYETVIRALSRITAPALGLYQVLFQPVDPMHNWHQNVQILLDLEYTLKQTVCSALAPWRIQEVPSGERHGMARELDTKAHNDKPFFAAALRAAIIGGGQDAPAHLLALTAFSGLIQHGGRPLAHLRERAYQSALALHQLRDMFICGQSYRSGFLVNSAELTSLAHLPPTPQIADLQLPVATREILTVTPNLAQGCHVGYAAGAGSAQPVHIPVPLRFEHTHLIGGTGCGKSNLLEHIILDDIHRGEGVAVIDPHRYLVDRLLDRIPASALDRVIFIEFGDPNWVPIFNPFHVADRRTQAHVAEEMVGAFKGIVDGWGDRLEHLLRFTIQGLLHLPGASLLDVSNALQVNQVEGKRLRKEVLGVVENALLRRFWSQDLKKYRAADLHPPQHKLSKLLGEAPLATMLSQTESSFQLRQVMDQGQILILDLSGLTDETRAIFGCLMLALLRITALNRCDTAADDLHPFHIHVDEAQLFISNAIEQIIAQTRKYRVSLTVANIYLRQFPQARTDALASVGSSIIFKVNAIDAARFCKDLQERVKVEEITRLPKYRAIARIGSDIVRFDTREPRPPLEVSCRDAIIKNSRQRYYRPAETVRRAMGNRGRRWPMPHFPRPPWLTASTVPDGPIEELVYDEF